MGSSASESDDAADALCDTALLDDNELLDLAGVLDVSATAELDRNAAPVLALGLLQELLYGHADTDNTDRVRVCLPKDCSDA